VGAGVGGPGHRHPPVPAADDRDERADEDRRSMVAGSVTAIVVVAAIMLIDGSLA
jgi:hypothetical protein